MRAYAPRALIGDLLHFNYLTDWARDLPLFFSRSAMKRRVHEWKCHARAYADLKNQDGVAIDYLDWHLDVLDRKFSVALQFQGLLVIAIGLALRGDQLDLGASGWLQLAAVSWALGVAGCLKGLFRVKWGVGMNRRHAGKRNEAARQLDTLARSVVRRTAWVRLVSVFVSATLILLALAVGAPEHGTAIVVAFALLIVASHLAFGVDPRSRRDRPKPLFGRAYNERVATVSRARGAWRTAGGWVVGSCWAIWSTWCLWGVWKWSSSVRQLVLIDLPHVANTSLSAIHAVALTYMVPGIGLLLGLAAIGVVRLLGMPGRGASYTMGAMIGLSGGLMVAVVLDLLLPSVDRAPVGLALILPADGPPWIVALGGLLMAIGGAVAATRAGRLVHRRQTLSSLETAAPQRTRQGGVLTWR